MAKYEVLVDSVILGRVVKAGEVIEYDGKSEGKPGANLRLVKTGGAAAPVETQVETQVDSTNETAPV